MVSCSSLKMHERVYVNDPEMQMGDGSAAQFEDYVESIRGSSVPAKSKKGSGGCGCN
jgi:predicted double-glycine peptidase